MPLKIDLVAIDCQLDFCNPNGSLFVPGADKDMGASGIHGSSSQG